MINLRFPQITGFTEKEQLVQIKSYLHQLVQELNWVLTNMQSGNTTETNSNNQPATGLLSEETFLELKALLIQSSDTLNAYYDKINAKLEGFYLKQDVFSKYKEEVSQRFVGLAKQYVSQSDYEAYTQSVAQRLDGLVDQYIAKAVFEAYQQSMTQTIGELVQNTAFDTYKQNNDQVIAGLQGDIEALRQMINDMQNTGGE